MSGDLTVTPATTSQTLSIRDQMAYAKALAEAQVLPEAYRNRPADVLVAMGLGQSMGLSPTESLYRINVIKGKPTASAELIASQVRRAGHKLRIAKNEQSQSVTVTIIRRDDPDYPFTVTRDREWAQRMNLASKPNYVSQPMTMLTWRAITACAREACPEALYGVVYTPDEMHDLDDTNVTVEHVSEDTAKPDETHTDTPPSTGPAPDAEIMADRQQAAHITQIMVKAGVASTDMARIVLKRYTGRDLDSPRQLTSTEADTLIQFGDNQLIAMARDALSQQHAAAEEDSTPTIANEKGERQ